MMDSPLKDKGLILVLLEAVTDSDSTARKAISMALIQVGSQNACFVLSSIRKFLDNTQTTPKAHIQSVLYGTAEGIIREKGGERLSTGEEEEEEGGEEKEDALIKTWVEASLQLLIQSAIAHDLQQAASRFLVALVAGNKKHSDTALNSLIAILKPEEVPPQNIIETLTLIACSNSRKAALHFKPILRSLLPFLANVKHDNLRLAMASMLAKFSEGVVDAVANKGPAEALTVEEHHEPCHLVYDVLVHHWIKTSSVTVKNEIILCLGHMSYLLSNEKLELYAAAVVSAIIGHYKRNPCPFTITLSLALICDAVIKMGIESSLKLHVDAMLTTLFSQACAVPNFSEPHTVKNHCEVLRCFDTLSKTSFSQTVISLLVQRLENASHAQRVGSLLVLKHLINSRSLAPDHVTNLILILNVSLADPNSKVVRNVAQVIVALCHNGHLDASSGLPFVTYLVQHSAGGDLDARKRRSSLSEDFVGDVCCRALNLLATSVTPALPLLWPHLLHFLTNLEYQNSFPTILSCLAALLQNPATKPGPDGGPSPFADSGPTSAPYVVAHLLLMCSSPKGSLGLPALSTLQGIAEHLSPAVSLLWGEHLPQLKETFASLSNAYKDPSALQMWQDSLRDFLGCTIEAIGSDSFTCNLIHAHLDQLDVWEKNQGHRCFLISLIGVSLKHCVSRSLVDSTLDALFALTNHKSCAEQESLSVCVGTCSVTHMSLVLTHIEAWLKSTDALKRSSLSLFYLLKSQDGRSEEASFARSSLVLCLGQMASLAPPDVLAAHVDGPIMLHLLNIINSNKSDLVNSVTLETVSKIARALSLLPSFRLRQRPLFLTHVVNTLKQEGLTLAALSGALQVLRDLAALEPEMNVEQRTIVLQASLAATLHHLQTAANDDDAYLQKVYSQLNVLIRTVIQRDTCPSTLDDVTTLLHAWTLSPSALVRTKAGDLLVSSFSTFVQHVVLTQAGPCSFNQTCQLLAMLTPRLADPCPQVRTQAVASLSLVLKILARYNGQAHDHQDQDLIALKGLEEEIKEMSGEDLPDALTVIAKVLCDKLSFVQVRVYLSLVAAGLQDLQPESSSGVARVLAAILDLRGHQFHQHIKEILDLIYRRLEKVSDPCTRRHSVEAVCNLARHNVVTVIDVIMTYPVPFDKSICETLHRLGMEGDLALSATTHLSLVLERTPFFSLHQTPADEDVKIASLPTLTAICCMKELLSKLSVPKGAPAEGAALLYPAIDTAPARQMVSERLPSLVALLLLSYGSYIGTMAPLHQSGPEGGSKNSFIPNRSAAGIVPSRCALECLGSLVSLVGCPHLEEALNTEILNPNGGDSFHDFLNTVSTIALLFSEELPGHISSLVAYLDTHHNHEIQRVTVTAVFGQLVAEKCCGDFELLEIVTSGLLSRLNDRSSQVRRLAVKGLANFARLQTDQTSGEVREASMGVLRGLSESVGSADEFREHLSLHLLTAIVHLEDPHPSMVAMCKSVLQSLGSHLASPELEFLFKEHLEPSRAFHFHLFIPKVAKHLVSGEALGEQMGLFLQVSSSYFRHSEPSIRRASILLAGHLVKAGPASSVVPSMGRVYHGLVFLLRDSDQGVRAAAASVVPLVAKHRKML